MIARQADAFADQLGYERQLLLIEARNEPEPLIAYIGAIRAGHAVILVASGTLDKDSRILNKFRPRAVYSCRNGSWELEFVN